jgi:septal ring factor EnvC (AmiA/AmiB activator)
VEEYKSLLSQWKEKFNHESDSRKMLDDNLRVLGRRISELELELISTQEKLSEAEQSKRNIEDRLSGVHDQQSRLR